MTTSPRRVLRVVAVAVLLAMNLVATPSSAQTAADVKRADDLFREAKALADAGTYAGACPKLEESQRLDPALGTEFNLADCYEHTGRVPEAYALFGVVAAEAHVAGKAVRERESRVRMRALEGRVARMRVVPALPPDVRLRLDGMYVREGSDTVTTTPGKHAVEATADGREPWNDEVELRAGEVLDLRVPDLHVRPVVPPPEPTPPLEPTRAPAPGNAPARPDGAPLLTSPPDRARAGLGAGRAVALVIGATGVVAIGVGSVAGLLAIAAHNAASKTCPSPDPCGDRTAAGDWTRATTEGNVATAGWVGGAVLVAGAAVLWLATGHSDATRPLAFCSGEACGVGAQF